MQMILGFKNLLEEPPSVLPCKLVIWMRFRLSATHPNCANGNCRWGIRLTGPAFPAVRPLLPGRDYYESVCPIVGSWGFWFSRIVLRWRNITFLEERHAGTTKNKAFNLVAVISFPNTLAQ
jgi:hypothetical protein